MFHKFMKGLKHDIKNQGEELIITVKGNKEQIAKLEKKLQAIMTLTSDCCPDCCSEE